MKKKTLISFLIVFVCFLSTPLFAQTTGGSVQGFITDESGAPLPGAMITAVQTARGNTRTATSDSSGFYRFTELPVGPYEFTVTLSSFSTQVRSGINILVGQQASLNFTLKLSPVEETITVVDDVPVVEPTKTAIGATITEEQIDDLPLRDRNFVNLSKLSPGITTSSTEATDISGAGSSGSSNTLLIDGVSNDQDALGDLRGDFSPDAVSQFQVQSSSYQAEYGQASGAVINVITRSGTNDFHGRVGVFYRADNLSASNPFAAEEAPFDQTILSTFLSGPLVEDRLFVFGSFEYTMRDDTAVINLDPALLEGLGLSTNRTFEKPTRQPRVLMKLDYRPADNHTITGRYRLDRPKIENNLVGEDAGGGVVITDEAGVTSTETNQDFAVSHNWIVSENKLNEFRFQFARQDNDFTDVNCPECPMIIRPSLVSGKVANFPQTLVEDRWQFVNAFSFETLDWGGDHFFKTGIDYSHITLNAFVPQTFDGAFVFTTDAPFDANDPATYPFLFQLGSGNPNINISNNIFGFYFQDQWRVSPYFTLNLGVRWDYEDHPMVADDKNNFGPRLHFSWDARKDGTTVIRGGYGLYYDQIFLNAPLLSSIFEPGRFENQFILFPGFPDPFEGGQQIPLPLPPNLSQLDENSNTPSKDVLSFGLQRELNKDTGLSIDGVFAWGDNLLLLRDANAPINGVRPDPTVGLIFSVEAQGRSEYKALQVGLQRRFSDRYAINVAYTLSDTEDNTVGHRSFVSDSYDLDADFGPSDNDIRHTLNAAALLEVPWGIKLGLGTSATSGPHYNIVTGIDTNGDGEFNERPPGVERNSGDGDALWTVDARASKVFTVGRAQMEFIVEAFNLFNRTNAGGFNGNQQSPLFGQPTLILTGFEPRQVQLAVRVDF
jgi:outer membrane receptor for ferrienterochelin and colicin